MTQATAHATTLPPADVLAENPMAGLGTPASHAMHGERALGFWLYLMSDAVIFAILFANYLVLSGGTAGGPGPHQVLELGRAAQETALQVIPVGAGSRNTAPFAACGPAFDTTMV